MVGNDPEANLVGFAAVGVGGSPKCGTGQCGERRQVEVSVGIVAPEVQATVGRGRYGCVLVEVGGET